MRFNLSKLNDARVLDQRDYNNLVEYINELVNEVVNLKRQLLLLDNSALAGSNSFLAIIDGSSPDGDNKWKYTWTEVIKNDVGYTAGSFADRAGGRTGTAENGYYARNIQEYSDNNGNLQPCPEGEIVEMRSVRRLDNQDIEYWFEYGAGNLLDGEPLELDFTQGAADTDDYDRDRDKVPVKLKVITDEEYDESDHQWKIRTREIVADGIKTISAESEQVFVVQFVEHPV